ncbi:MAG TPA: glycoside hydrolase family 3 C-terminal domain-containing protein [Anaerolineaceae bacterium]
MSKVNRRCEEWVNETLSKMTLKEKVSLLSGKDTWRTVQIDRLGVPAVVMTDGPHGVRTGPAGSGRITSPATAFPTGIGLASTWNPELVKEVGKALAEETRALGCDILLGPCVNIVRSPLGGRNFETYSEDPYLAGRMAIAYIEGVQSRNVGTSLKHFACNNQEYERNRGNSVVDERTLHEIYLPAFEAAVKEANPWTVMCSYNRLNGEYASQNYTLLREILKQDWEYDGVVVSDWGANHSVIESVDGGLDIEMPGPEKYYGQLLLEGVTNWQIDEATIDDSVRRILRLVYRCKNLESPEKLPQGSLNTPEHTQLALDSALESMILLKNTGQVLPLQPATLKRLAVIGPNAANAVVSGGGSAYVEPPYRVSPLEGLHNRLGGDVEILYAEGCHNWVEPPVLPASYLMPPEGEEQGLQVEFFNNPDLEGNPVVKRVDQKLSYFWRRSPAPEVNVDGFSCRWSGSITVPESGSYTFRLVNSDSCRVWINGKLVVENHPGVVTPHVLWNDAQSLAVQGAIDLEAGKTYPIKMEFKRTPGEPFAKLELASIPPEPVNDPVETAVALAKTADAAVVIVGMPLYFETEGKDRPHMEFPGRQNELIHRVAQMNPKTVVVVNCGAPVAMPWVDEVPAILDVLYPGMEFGNALAKLLLGDISPSGKLTETFPKRLQDNPAFLNYPGSKDVFYGEGIFVGYRYYEMKDVEPLFPFGHGLSYSTFEYANLKVPEVVKAGEKPKVTLTVKNTGKWSAKEVVQLYVRDVKSSLVRPLKELKGFQKIALSPGEQKRVTFTLDDRSFSFYDPYLPGWVAEAGEFEILVGASSKDIRQSAMLVYEKS